MNSNNMRGATHLLMGWLLIGKLLGQAVTTDTGRNAVADGVQQVRATVFPDKVKDEEALRARARARAKESGYTLPNAEAELEYGKVLASRDAYNDQMFGVGKHDFSGEAR